jgi:hypothetical protein
MGTAESELTDEDLLQQLERALLNFPRLKDVLPENFPRARRFDITLAGMRKYGEHLKDTFWHHLNLPLALHTYDGNPDENPRQLMASLLKTLGDFWDTFRDVPGARGLLAPLWEDLWGSTPQIWSVAACAYLALCYRNFGIEVLGFEQQIGHGKKDADLKVRIAGVVTHVEVEAFHRAEFASISDAELLAELEHRADAKAAKFVDLPLDETGVVGITCVVKDADVSRTLAVPGIAELPGRPKNVKWMGCRLVGVRHNGELRFALLPLLTS